MGMIKRFKDMKDMANAAPGLVSQARQLSAQAQEMAAAQQAALQAQMGGPLGGQPGGMQPGPAMGGAGLAGGPDFEPIAGVTLEQFASVSKGVAAYNYDASKLVIIAGQKGISAFAWDSAHTGWNDRIRSNPAVAQRFNQLYRES
jgi:hypothetical protein